MLIRAIAEFWNPEIVNWGTVGAGNKGALLGLARPASGTDFEVDLWNAEGVYILYSEFRPIYVGQASAERTGPRLREHRSDRLAGRWDFFSVFCTSTLNRTKANTRAPGIRRVAPEVSLDTVEAVLIAALQPPLNRRFNSIPDATRVTQHGANRRGTRSYLEEILQNTKSLLDGLDDPDATSNN